MFQSLGTILLFKSEDCVQLLTGLTLINAYVAAACFEYLIKFDNSYHVKKYPFEVHSFKCNIKIKNMLYRLTDSFQKDIIKDKNW